MLYSESAMESALAILSQRREKSQKELEEKKREAYKHLPELAGLDKQISQVSLLAIKKIAAGANHCAIEELKRTNQNLQVRKEQLLAENEIPVGFLKVKPICSACKDEGYVDGVICECLKKLLIKEMSKTLNLKVALERFSFANFKLDCFSAELIDAVRNPITQKEQARQNYDYCWEFANKFGPNSGNILMQGGTGLGKTHLSLSITKLCLDRGYSVVYVLAGQMICCLEDERFNRGEQKGSVLHSFLGCDLLIIDDFGSEPQNQFAISSLYNIINLRLLAEKSTIINTNLSGAEITRQYDERVSSRLFGEYKVLRFYGNDIRLQRR
jgi:DNA replication protein DnaC